MATGGAGAPGWRRISPLRPSPPPGASLPDLATRESRALRSTDERPSMADPLLCISSPLARSWLTVTSCSVSISASRVLARSCLPATSCSISIFAADRGGHGGAVAVEMERSHDLECDGGSGGKPSSGLVPRDERRVIMIEELKRQPWPSGPLIGVSMLQYSVQVISVMFVGRLRELPLSGVSMATSFASITGFSVLVPLSTPSLSCASPLKFLLLLVSYCCVCTGFEYWSFELVVLLSGLLPNSKLEMCVLSISLNTCWMVYMISVGLGGAIRFSRIGLKPTRFAIRRVCCVHQRLGGHTGRGLMPSGVPPSDTGVQFYCSAHIVVCEMRRV
ncbi:hypothetical protein NL676_032049 [Syzygium grande]|nr:hypothetical protein NL676_032049 [Syzygium grande]